MEENNIQRRIWSPREFRIKKGVLAMKDHPKTLWATFHQIANWVETTDILKSLDIMPSSFY